MRAETVTFLIFLVSFSAILILSFIDMKRKKPLLNKPKISVIIPTYNDAESIGKTVDSLYKSYDPKNFELIIVNDCSTDNTLAVLKDLAKNHKFRLLNNKENLGKVGSLNNASKYASHDLILFLDSDVIVSKRALEDLIINLQFPKVAASTCRYKPKNKGFLARLQEMEYGMNGLIQTAYNNYSSITLWGGCILIRKDIFEKVGKFSINCLAEDLELGFVLKEHGWKTRESHYYVESFVPGTLKELFKQRIRWNGGFGQSIFYHKKIFFSHPLVIFFTFSNIVLAFSFIAALLTNIVSIDHFYSWFVYFHEQGYSLSTSYGLSSVNAGFNIVKSLAMYFLFPLFCLPYVLVNFNSKKEWYKVFFVFPYSIFYIPLYTVMGTLGIIKGIILSFKIKKDERAW